MGRIVRLPPNATLRSRDTVIGGWWHEDDQSGRIVCDLCPRRCALKEGQRGFCFVRQNVEGQLLLTTYGRSTGFCVDPIEKKPLNHFLPGTAVLSFGTAGCNLGCKFCQNWDISKSREVERASAVADPETIAEAAGQLGCRSVAFTYNDPIIWAEYAIDTARACHRRGIQTVAVTAGYITAEARGPLFAVMDAANVDLKALSEEFYFELAYAHMQPVLDTLQWLKRETDVWFEITNLIIPRANDTHDNLRRLCDWILQHVGDEVPTHFTAFHPAFKMLDRPATPHETLMAAYELARKQGIKYVYVGNVHDPERDSTYCPYCSTLLIERNWHQLGTYRLKGGRCPRCDGRIAGRFEQVPGTWGARRLPVRISQYAVPPRSNPSGDTTMAGTPDSNEASPGTSTLPVLTEHQELLVYRAASEIVVAGVQHRPPNLADPELGGAASMTVMGAFVTLKRQTHLRACCGTLGRPMSLIDGVRQAAYRTATEDLRLPPISPTELSCLSLEVSLLYNFRPLQSKGAERAKEVELGRHGLTIRRGEAGGLLLPSVAVEHGWDTETLLRQVCRKAGLPSTAWLDDATQLQTFEARVIEGRIDQDLLQRGALQASRMLSSDQLRQIEVHCRDNIRALVTGATPNYYLPACPDATVQGVALTVSLPSTDIAPQFAKLSIRPGLPLQATLFQLCEAASGWFNGRGLSAQQLDEVQLAVAVLYDSALHGTVGDPDLEGFDPRNRALLVVEQGRSAWVLDPEKQPEQLLEAAAAQAQVLSPETAGVFSFAADSNCAAFTVTSLPRPQTGPTTRPPAVAGMFYPGNAEQLDEMVVELLERGGDASTELWPAALVPHAGLRFSGHIAAATLKQVTIPKRIVILAPKHTRHGAAWAVAPHEAWSIPGHTIESDVELARQLVDAIPRLQLDAAAHREEHAIEVQLPLLANLAPRSRVVGVTIGGGDLNACLQFAEGLTKVFRAQEETPLLLISTDLNHYASDDENRRLDQIALEAIQKLDPDYLYQTIRDHNISMCGVLPAVIVLQTLKNLDLPHGCQLIDYATSADATGNKTRVVGYAGMLLR